MSDQEEEILGKIEQAHVRGEHTLGPFAGCALCASFPAVGPDNESPEELLERLAARQGAAAALPEPPPDPDRDLGERALGELAKRDADRGTRAQVYALVAIERQLAKIATLVAELGLERVEEMLTMPDALGGDELERPATQTVPPVELEALRRKKEAEDAAILASPRDEPPDAA